MADFYLLTVIQILTIIFSIWNYDRSYECKYVHYIQPTKFRGFFEWKTSTVDWLITVRRRLCVSIRVNGVKGLRNRWNIPDFIHKAEHRCETIGCPPFI